MTIAIESQVFALAASLLVGAALGLFYDLLRPFRLAGSALREWLLDFLFWIVAALTIFICAPLFEDGQIRIYMLIAYFIGAVAYFKLLSRPIRAFFTQLTALWRRVKAVLLRPFRRIYSALAAPLSQFFRKVEKSFKNLFSFPARWVRMKRIAKNEAAARRAATESEEAHWHEGQSVYCQKGWSSHEDCGDGFRDLRRIHAGKHAGADLRDDG